MDPDSIVDERVEIICGYYKNRPSSQIAVPLKMRYKNKEIKFTELGLRHPTMKGQRMVHVFDMSDGTCDYRIEFDAEALTWTLVALIGKEKP